MQTIAHDCPNCSAPLKVPLGEVETGCAYCGSRLKILPGESELEVVRTREEMKRKERVDVQRIILEQQLKRSEEHTSELQSQSNLVCRLLLEKKKKTECH